MGMTAREKFHKGQRVSISESWISSGRYCPSTHRGVVVGFSWDYYGPFVRVIRAGMKTPESWHMDAWEPTRKRRS